ncbi:hypothetical protein GCM10009001_22310 [Virgibacillus siamensis]|uniref:Uncharacterized protein n=1 Tax=Virgibacillus siamensis TaxID=480071 RepID=A0ABN1G5U0_9BACI
MLRKSFFILMSTVLLVGMLPLETLAKTSTDNTKTVYGMGNEYTESQSLKLIKATEIMEDFIVKKGNKLVIDSKAKDVVKPFVYDYFLKGVHKINESVQKGEINLDSIKSNLTTTQTNDSGIIKPMDYTDSHWWGVEWFLSYSEAQHWKNYFSDWSFNWATVAALAGILGAAPASVAAVLMAVGNHYMYREIRDNTSWRGTELTFRWATPWVWAQPR